MNAFEGPLGYCTNVHAGDDLATTVGNLERHALAVRAAVSPDHPMGIGLWLAARAAKELLRERRTEWLASWLRDAGLIPYTLNGFPYGDFHQRVVKHQVYHPTWWEPARLEYTLDLIAIQHALLPEGMPGTISTLPIAWGEPRPTHDQLLRSAAQLRAVADRLRCLERETGRLICLCLEPEPGCYLQRSMDVVRFFHDYLWQNGDAETIRRYLRVCHDICHSAVMFEPQAIAWKTYQTGEILVGKVQVSSAVGTPDLTNEPPGRRATIVSQLREFREERYLHQTVVRLSGDEQIFYEDLPLALHDHDQSERLGEWRVHFHVPIYAEDLDHLRTTQGEIRDFLLAARSAREMIHWEVETYAWGVLPARWRRSTLAEGIAEEIRWCLARMAELDRTQVSEDKM